MPRVYKNKKKPSVSVHLIKENDERTNIVNRLSRQIKTRLTEFSEPELKEMDSKLTKLLDLLADSESNYQLLNEILKTLWVK